MKKLLLASLISATIFSSTPVCAMDTPAKLESVFSRAQSASLMSRIKTNIQTTLQSKKFWALVAFSALVIGAAAYQPQAPVAPVIAEAHKAGVLPPLDVTWQQTRTAYTPLFGAPYPQTRSWAGIFTPNRDCEAVLNSDHAKNLVEQYGGLRCMEVAQPVYKKLAAMKAEGVVDIPLVDNAVRTASKYLLKTKSWWS